MHSRIISKQRNFITHNIYALFIDQLDETILEKNNLLDSDVHLYIKSLAIKRKYNRISGYNKTKK